MSQFERLDRLISKGEIILQNAKNMEFCCEKSIWDACFHREEVEAIRDKWNREVLNFLDDEFGSHSAVYGNFRLNLQSCCYTLEDEIKDIRNCLAVLRAERQHLQSQML